MKRQSIALLATRTLRYRGEYGTLVVPLNGALAAQVVRLEATDGRPLTPNPLRWWPSEVHPGCIEVRLDSADEAGGHPDTILTVVTEPLRLGQKVTLRVAPARQFLRRFPAAWRVLKGRPAYDNPRKHNP